MGGYRWWLGELEKNEGGIEQFAEGYKIFGFIRDDEKGALVFLHRLKGRMLAMVLQVGMMLERDSQHFLSPGGFTYREWLPNAKQARHYLGMGTRGPQAVVLVSIYQGFILGTHLRPTSILW